MMVGEAIMEPLTVHHIVPRRQVREEAERLMGLVHLPAEALQRYPYQLNAGQLMRAGIARAIAVRPKLIICDESLSVMDVSVQAQILNLLKELQAELKLSCLFISRDLNVVHYIADRVLVVQAGKIVERGSADEVFKHAKEPYTQQLVRAML
jgi:ABC-type oligopeptide transport system ATPase subunit